MEVVSTDEIPMQERFPFWREVSSELWVPYDLHAEPTARREFRASVSVSDLGPVKATLMTTTPHSVSRTPRLIRRSDPEVFKLGCSARSRHTIAQDGRRTCFEAGDLALYDTSRPYEAGFAPDAGTSQIMLLRFPRSLLPFSDRDLRHLTAARIPGSQGMGALSSQFLLQLARHLHELTPSDAARLSTLTLDVLTAGLARALDTERSVPPHTRRRALTAEIYAFIHTNLGEPALAPDMIAAAHHISLRYLHQLFREQGRTVAAHIRERRLARCRSDLADPRLATRPIHAIAARWGFTSSAYFSQAFRSAYGLSPRQFRQQCATARGGRARVYAWGFAPVSRAGRD